MMIIENCEKIYLDANFLVYWFAGKEPSLRKRARLLLTSALVEKKKLYSSPLAFDEAWNSIRKITDAKLSCSDESIFLIIQKFTNQILLKVSLLQFLDSVFGTKRALNNIQEFKLKPRDAFHLSLMQDNSIRIIFTNDIVYQKIQGIANIVVKF